MAEKVKKPVPPPSPADDLIPRSMLPDKSVIPEWRQFGYGAGAVKPKDKKEVKRMRSGGSVSSASKRADGCAMKGKTRGKFV